MLFMQIQYVIRTRDLEAPVHNNWHTYLLLEQGELAIPSGLTLTFIKDEGTEQRLRGKILECLGVPWYGPLVVGKHELHYKGARIMRPLVPNPALVGVEIPRKFGEEITVTLTEWFSLLLPVLHTRPDLCPDPKVPLFQFESKPKGGKTKTPTGEPPNPQA